MKHLLLCLSLFLLSSHVSYASTEEQEVLSNLLNNFLANKVQNDRLNHDSFWADDLIYTSSSGARFNKAFIMKGIKEGNDDDSLPPLYWAEETDIRVYGDTAIVAFKLMHKENKNAKQLKQTYFNTGTFLKRDGKWQAVAWQATKIPMQK